MRRFAAALTLGLVSFLLTMLLHATGALERLELLTLDARYATGIGRKPPGDDIVIAWIDQESLDEFEQREHVSFPWPRTVWEAAMRYLLEGGAKAVVFDVLFDQAMDPADDAEFAKALADSKVDVLVTKFMTSRKGARNAAETERFGRRGLPLQGTLARAPEAGVALPLPEFEAGADQLGFANIRADADKAFRRYDLLRCWQPDAARTLWYPSLALAAAAVVRGSTELRATPEGVAVGTLAPAPADPQGRMLLNFRGPEFTFEHVKFVNIAQSINARDAGQEPPYPAERFRDKIVLVGINAEGYEDTHPTPTSRLFPGVELHATALDNLLRGDALRAPAWELPLAAAAVAATTAVVFLVPGVGASVAAVLALLAMGLGASLWLWAQLLAVPVAAPAVGGLLGSGSSFLWRLAVEGRQKRQLRAAFSSYLAPEVLAEVLRNPGHVALGGETREVTLLFTDLAGFTGLAEHVGPQALVAFLNDYFTRMCEPVLAQRGVIDKFIGDAIMALFGAPLRSDDHALCAVRAALAGARVSAAIAAELRAAGRPPIETRIGIHTGPAVVGNMGSSRRFDYTAIGDTVNLASRLEGANKAFGTRCLVSETAWARAGAQVLGREVGSVAVKGRAAPIRVFEPLVEADRADAADREFAERWAAGVAALRAGRRAEAVRAFAQIAALRPDDALAALWRQQLLDPQWDGVFRLDSK